VVVKPQSSLAQIGARHIAYNICLARYMA